MGKDQTLSITLLGSNSGRNAGDAAILAAIMRALSEELNGRVRFEVPTTHPQFVEREYGAMFDVRPISVMPWTGSIRLLGIPTLRSIKRTDCTFITDGIIFDVNLFNPLFNFLITLIFLVPWARLWGKKVVCYDVGIGPLRSFWGRRFARWVGNGCDLIMVRDQDSKTLFQEIGVTKEIHLTADAVFCNWGASEARSSELFRGAGIEKEVGDNTVLGVNVTRYVDRWLADNEKVEAREEFLPMFAGVLLRLKLEQGITPAIFTTQVMDADFGRRLQTLVEDGYYRERGEKWKPALFSNESLNNHELLALSAKCRLYVGMRVHSLIIAAQAGTAVVGLIYAPKVRSFLKELNTPERSIELASITSESLYESLLDSWKESSSIEAQQQDAVADLGRRARRAAEMIRERYAQPSGSSVDSGQSQVAVNE